MKNSDSSLPANKPRDFWKKYKWLILTLVFSVVSLFTILMYAYKSVQVWEQIETVNTETREAVKADIASLEKSEVSPKELVSRAKRIEQSINDICNIPAPFKWQSEIFDHTREVVNNCENAQDNLSKVHTALRAIITRNESEQDFVDILEKTQLKLSETAQDEYEVLKNAWVEFKGSLVEWSPHSSLLTTKNATISSTQEIILSYDALIIANRVEKRNDFDAAVVAVEENYKKFAEIQVIVEDSYTDLVNDLNEAIKIL